MKRVLFALVLSLYLIDGASAEVPVHFPDANLKAAVENALWVSDPTPTDMLSLTAFSYRQDWGEEDEGISDLTGLEYAANLRLLNLRRHRISSISALSALVNLESVDLSRNEISDLSPLSGLSNLMYLNLHGNCISDISPLSGLTNLETLILHLNEISDLSPLSGMMQLREIDLGSNHVSDLGPLSSLTQLSTLGIWINEISDISPLSSLMNLETLDADVNRISDLSPLSALSNLRNLQLMSNRISDVSPLSSLSSLRALGLENNIVSDISPLCGLTSLASLDVRGNPLTQETYDIYFPLLVSNNPRVNIVHDLRGEQLLSTSSTPGGSIIDPGEGEFSYDYGVFVRLEARPDPGFVFAGWSGTYWAAQNPAFVTMNEGHQIQANFQSLSAVLHVDDDARTDPGPEDPKVSDPNENGTAEHPFDSIQEAIKVAREGISVLVGPGTYRENIDFLRKNVQVIGRDPNDPKAGAWPVLEGTGNSPVVRFDGGQSPSCLLTGFVITRGAGWPAGAIYCEDASPTITHCLIVGNRSTDPNGAVVYCENSQAVLTNCTMADNYAGENGAGLTLIDSEVTVLNSILWDNMPDEILASGTSVPDIRYCAVRGWWSDWGNIHKNPLFARPGSWVNPNELDEILASADARAVWVAGDYHLRSQAGRWDPQAQGWVRDEATSAAIDAGLASSPVGQEPAPNGGRINMGVYGGTSEASRSSIPTAVP